MFKYVDEMANVKNKVKIDIFFPFSKKKFKICTMFVFKMKKIGNSPITNTVCTLDERGKPENVKQRCMTTLAKDKVIQ